MDGKKLNQNICVSGWSRNGGTETEIRSRIQVAANAWRKVEEVMGDRHTSRKLKGKKLSSFVRQPTCMA